jgi:adenylylsulfate kinase
MKEKLHIIPHNHVLNIADRNKLNGHKSKAIWFVGLSGSGKSTIAGRVEQELYSRGLHAFLLDGDNVRSGLNQDLDFSVAARTENIRRISEVTNLMVNAGLLTVVAFISPLAADRAKARETVGDENFMEVYVECPLEVCEQRDVKGLYAKARAGEIPDFTGISSPFEAPENPEIKVNTAEMSEDECVEKIVTYILNAI